MYTIGWRSLRHVCPSLSKEDAIELAGYLGDAMHTFHINTPSRAAMFIAQTAHESGQYRFREEIWGPTEAQNGYDFRRDLGNIVKGDGKKFKGRGYIQITGRMNYRSISHAWGVGDKYVAHPTLLANKSNSAKSAAWWWDQHGCNNAADTGDFIKVTRIINGGTNGLAERKMYYRRAKRVQRWLVPKRK